MGSANGGESGEEGTLAIPPAWLYAGLSSGEGGYGWYDELSSGEGAEIGPLPVTG